jgi:uncharacterized membrane protein YbhN (UPF0104 family)
MQPDQLLQSDAPSSTETEKKSSGKKALLFTLHAIAFIAGLTVVFVLVYRNRGTISDALASVGWGFLLLVSFNIIRHFMRAASMYRAIAPEHRTFKYRWAVAARFGGEAVTLFSAFTGPYLGDATKVMLMKKDLPLTHGASAVIIDNILYYTSVIFIVLTGVVTLLLTYGSSGSTMSKVLLAIVVAMVIAFSVFAMAILFKITPFTRVLDLLTRLKIAPQFLLKKRQSILDVENNVFQFYHTRPRDFFIVFGISLCVHLMSIAEVFFAIKFLGYESTIAKAVIIEGLTKVVNLSYGFIPANVGVYEGGNVLILKTIGYPPGVGVALALVRRGASLCGNLIGVIVLFWRGAMGGAKKLSKAGE